jgi:hypothetical protein
MTDQEKKLQRAQLQIELDDAQSELAHFQEAALALVDHISQAIGKLQRNAELRPSPSDFSVDAELENRLDPDQRLDIERVRKLIAEMRAARQKVYNLQNRKAKLASAAGWTVAS